MPARGAVDIDGIECKEIDMYVRSFSACSEGQIACITEAELHVHVYTCIHGQR